jgi:hypothetical protein
MGVLTIWHWLTVIGIFSLGAYLCWSIFKWLCTNKIGGRF